MDCNLQSGLATQRATEFPWFGPECKFNWPQSNGPYVPYLREEDWTCDEMLDRLNDDTIVEVCSFLDVYSLLSMVKALAGVPYLRSVHKRLANLPVSLDTLKDEHLQAEVMAHLHRVTWHTSNMDSIQFFAYKYPGYHFSVGVDYNTGVGLEVIEKLPQQTTSIKLWLNESPLEYAAPKAWPSELRELTVTTAARSLVVSPPTSIRKLKIKSPSVVITNTMPNLTHLALKVNSVKTKGPICVRNLEISGWGKVEFTSIQRFVEQCQGVVRLVTDLPGLKYSDSVTDLSLTTNAVPRDPRITSLTLVRETVHPFDLPQLRKLTVMASDYRQLIVPASVTELTLSPSRTDKGIADIYTILTTQVVNPASIVALTLKGNHGTRSSLMMPTLKNWTALSVLTVEDFTMPYICVDAPALDTLTVNNCDLENICIMCSTIRKLELPNNDICHVPVLPDSVEYLDITYNPPLEKNLFIFAKRLATLIVSSNDWIERVYYNSARLRLADADWYSLEYFGPMNSGTISQLPCYMFDSFDSAPFIDGKWKYDAETTQVGQSVDVNSGYKEIRLPPAVEVVYLQFFSAYDIGQLMSVWCQAPRLKCLKMDFALSGNDFNQLWLPSSAINISLLYPPDDNDASSDVWLMFGDRPTSLEWLYVSNRRVRWETIGGRIAHPNLRFVNGQSVNLLDD
ncbi:hypothetical protein DICA0_B06876 [Diutina catenulata]